MIDTDHMRDLQGRTVHPGDTVRAHRLSSKAGIVFDFEGYVCAVRTTHRPGRLEALVQAFDRREAAWLGGRLVEVSVPPCAALEGVLCEWL